MSFWTNDVIDTRKRQKRLEQHSKEHPDYFASINPDGEQVVLGLHHLLGAFLFLAVGSILACLSLIAETFGSSN
ncbi:hypothetical protein Pcinc_007464 [Petrolisthes cinctipes]|uniref:Uncharacterized protein n=1 Tax=Petrolisthes cinctipes TaxID=88211 RepID=A0AAE1GB02_PETCI|nr:hypothetical protein Pcinc_030295 [Petrolisthes cinctipes]KAK3888482.1 hypothetical protein Pcinc_007464 [Petrolisthes cinctipes]